MPLQTILQNCAEIENKINDEEIKENILTTKMLSKLMICRMKDMQDWKDIKAGKFRKVSENFQLSECLKEIYEMMSIKARHKNLKIELKLAGTYFPTWVTGDRMRFQKIALNLTNNAVDNTKQGFINISVTYQKSNE